MTGLFGRVWLARSRFADVARLAGQTLTLSPDADAFYHLGWAKQATGFPAAALAAYDQALTLYRDVGDRAGEAVTRYNIAMIYRDRGDLARAITELEQVVDLDRQVGHPDLASDAATLERLRHERGSDNGPLSLPPWRSATRHHRLPARRQSQGIRDS